MKVFKLEIMDDPMMDVYYVRVIPENNITGIVRTISNLCDCENKEDYCNHGESDITVKDMLLMLEMRKNDCL